MVAAVVLVMAAIVTVAAVLAYRHTPPAAKKPAPRASAPSAPSAASSAPQPPQAAPNGQLATEFTRFAAGLPAKVGIAFSPVGGGQNPTVLGDWAEGPAWSTSKVPVVIAAYRRQQPPQITSTMRAAIVESDNAAAESVWASLGDPPTAAQQVQQILRESGDPATVVQSQKIRPEFTAFGQTIWSLDDQVRFLAGAFCNRENEPIFDLMGQIEAGQSWGIGGIADTVFKGGWGPSTSGQYLVRQMGVLSTPAGKVAVAIATQPESGQFGDGTQQLNEIATWLKEHFAALPAGQCGR